MISFWVTRAASFGIRRYCENRGRLIADRFQPRFYEDIDETLRLQGDAHIFSALDQLASPQREVVAEVWDAHARIAPRAPRLNDPRHVLLRFDLLAKLHEQGINTFRVFRATSLMHVNRFPVFVRAIHTHDGPVTGLLRTRLDVARAVRALRLRGHRLRDLMIVEFCDTASADGLFRKYAAFKVGNSIIPCHVMVSHRWFVKSDANELDERRIREGIKYVEDNPHEAWLRKVFSVAKIDYGRVDYGVLDGVPQVWEINLNPTIGRGIGEQRHTGLGPDLKALREAGREIFHARLRAAFVALDGGDHAFEADVRIDKALITRVRAEASQSQRRLRVLGWLQCLYDHQRLGRPIRAVYAKLFPRR